MRVASAVAVAALAVAGCEASSVDPDATVAITGQVLDPSGGPLADRPVRLASGRTVSDAALAVVTVGLACTEGICQDAVRSTRTDAAGRYRLEVRGRETQTSFGNVRPQVLSAAAAPQGEQVSGASVAARFVVQTEQLGLPPLRLVDPGLALRGGSGRVDLSWSAAAAGPYTVTFETDAVVPVWQVTAGGSTATVDSRALEVTRGRVVVGGGLSDTVEGSDLEVTWRSPGVGYAATDARPLSRGRPCRFGSGSPTGAQQDEPCPLTDGDLVATEPVAPACPSPAGTGTPAHCVFPETATVDLGAAQPAQLVVVRGCSGGCAVDVSADGRTFRPAGSAGGAFAAVRLPPGPVRAVRVGLGEDGLREVSVWGPPEQQAALLPLDGGVLDELREPYASAPGDGVLVALVVLATALAGAAVLGLGYALGRRRPADTS